MRGLILDMQQYLSALPRSKSASATMQRIPDGSVSPAATSGIVLGRDMYFSLRVNQFGLSEDVEWFVKYDPMVVVMCSFLYGYERVTVPCVIGPDFIKNQLRTDPPRFGTTLTDICVTGPHPYRGGPIEISVCLYKVQRVNYAKSLLRIAEGLSQTLLTSQLSTWLSAGGTLLDAIGSLLGLDETIYLTGHQTTLAYSPLFPLMSGYYCVATPSKDSENPPQLRVNQGRLFSFSLDRERPYAESDFILFSLEGLERRDDLYRFPFARMKKDAIATISGGNEEIKRAKISLTAAYQELRKSNDFTTKDAQLILSEWINEFNKEEENSSLLGPMSASNEKEYRGKELQETERSDVEGFIRQLAL